MADRSPGFDLSQGPGDLLWPCIGVLGVGTMIVGVATGTGGGIGGMLCVVPLLIVLAAIEGGLLMIPAKIFGVTNFTFNEAFQTAGVGLFANFLLVLDQSMLELGLFGAGVCFLLKQLVDLAAVGKFCGLDWGKAAAVWGVWFAIRIVFWIGAAVVFFVFLVGAAGSAR